MYGFLVCLMFMFLCISANAETVVVYVDDDSACSNNCGDSSARAFRNLDEAIRQAVSAQADEIWVAEGTYRGPITLTSKIRIVGGFAGGEDAVLKSDPRVHKTSISGGQTSRAAM